MVQILAMLLVVGMWFNAEMIATTLGFTPEQSVQAEADPAAAKPGEIVELRAPSAAIFETLRSANIVRAIGITLLAILLMGVCSGIIGGGGFVSLPPYQPGVTVHATEKFPAIVPAQPQWETPDFWQEMPEVGRLIVLRKKGK